MTGEPQVGPRGRTATLVLVGNDGKVRGQVGPVELPEPWWQETGPITDILPGAAVLRLLEAEPDAGQVMGGTVTYLVHYDGPVADPLELRSWRGALHDHPDRLPWARPGGPADDLEWVASVVTLDPDRAPRQHRTWNLSTIWSIPVAADERSRGHDTVWLKCVPPFFQHEAAILDIMSDQPIPRLIAADRHRLLLEPMPGSDGYDPNPVEQRAMVDSLVDLQWASIERTEQLLTSGVPDLRSDALVDELSTLVRRLVPEDELLIGFVGSLPDRMDRITELGLPDVLGHGDPHGGNCRRGTDPVLWFDWGDGFIGHPLLDVASTHRLSPETVDYWLGLWAERAGTDAVHDGWTLLEPVSQLRMAWVYQRFLDNIEPSEHIYHRNDVPDALDDVRRSITAE